MRPWTFVYLAFAVSILFGTVRGMQAMNNGLEQRNKQLVRDAFDKWHKGTGGVFDLLSSDAQWTIVGNCPVSRTYKSKEEFIGAVIAPFNARLSKRLVPSLRRIYAEGDMVIALFDAEATALDGKPYRNTYTWFMKVRGDRIVEVIAFFDTTEFTDFWKRVNPVAAPSASARE